MQKVFEKIIEKLEEKARFYNSASDVDQNIRSGVIIAKEIVQEEAEDYNNGWIPCSSGKLPEEYKDVEVTVEEIANEVGGKSYYTVRSWLQEGQWVIKKNPYHPTVIAWKYPTEPYQPKGEE